MEYTKPLTNKTLASPAANADALPGAAPIDAHIAARLKALRAERSLTLQDLAAGSGVSRAMISKIERAEASATAALLHKLCTALGISLSDLLAPAHSQPSAIMRRSQRMRWQDPATGFVRETVTPRIPRSQVEVVAVTLPPQATVQYGPSVAGDAAHPSALTSSGYGQHIIAQTDGLRITQHGALGQNTLTTDLMAGDALFMWAQERFAFENLLGTPCQYLVVIEHRP